MASSFQSLFTIFILAITTFVVLDVNKNPTFEKTTTAKYINYIGAGPYVRKSLDTIQNSDIYKKYILPNYNSLIRALSPYVTTIKNHSYKQTQYFMVKLKSHSAKLLDYFEREIIPVVSEKSSILASRIKELILATADWLNNNLLTKLPREQMMKALNDFVASTQKIAINSYEYLGESIHDFIA